MLKDYLIPTVPEPDSDARLSAFLSSFGEHFDGPVVEIEGPHPAQCFFDANYRQENGVHCGKECLSCDLDILLSDD